jgi:hypothetical protein
MANRVNNRAEVEEEFSRMLVPVSVVLDMHESYGAFDHK